jgi:hypothetical protein
MQTVRIPLRDFPGFPAVGVRLRGVQLLFNRTAMGSIYVSNIRISSVLGTGVAALPPTTPPPVGPTPSPNPATATVFVHPQSDNTVVSIAPSSSGYDITLSSTDGFPFRNEVLVLQVGVDASGNPVLFTGGTYTGTDQSTIVFSLTSSQFAALMNGAPMTVQYGTDPPDEIWDFGTFNK